MTTDSLPNTVSPGAPIANAKPRRYHPLLVTLHWLIALLIFGAFFLAKGGENERGRFRPEGQPGNFPQQGFQSGNPPQGFPQNSFPQRRQNIFSIIGLHMLFGLTVLALVIIRVIVRYATKRPEWATAGNKYFNWIGELTHFGLYLLTFAIAITGIFLADQRGILARTFGIGSTPTPGSFRRGGFSIGGLHEAVWTLLVLLLILHIGAALYHQFILKDNLLSRMWWGKDKA